MTAAAKQQAENANGRLPPKPRPPQSFCEFYDSPHRMEEPSWPAHIPDLPPSV
jgi:hypothetical protein